MSIKKIAEKTGVSPATVSRVLNNPNYHGSSPDLRDKVWKAAIELNYVPNEAARKLKLGTSAAEKPVHVNILMTRMDATQYDPFFSELLHIVQSEIHKQVCILTQIWYLPVFSNDQMCTDTDMKQLIQDMKQDEQGYADGLIIIGKCNPEALKLLKKQYKSVVSINRNSTNYEVDEVLCDGEKIAAMAVEHLIQLGHHKIGYVGACNNEARYRGYLNTLDRHGLTVDASHIIETMQTEQEGYEAMEHMLASGNYPTGIYCANDITAIGMLKCLNQKGGKLRIPSIIASDDIEEAQNTKPMLTTVRMPKEEMGRFALHLLLDRIRGGHQGVVRIELEGKLIIRSSCAKVEKLV
jgi:DNA-binding LacI/PurR family transcriptional regulator